MNQNLLLVTGDTYFGKLLLQSLEREGYRVHVTKGKGEAVVRADEHNCPLAFLDSDLGYKVVSEIGRALRTLNPNIRLVLFSDEDTPPALDELRPWRLLHKPYHLPEVLTMLKDNSTPISKPTSKPVPSTPVQTATTEPSWLQDVS